MGVQIFLVVGQVFISLCVFWVVVAAAKKINALYVVRRPIKSLADGPRWPKNVTLIAPVWSVIAPLAERYVRPSAAIRQELRAVAVDARFDDREFSKLRLSVMTLFAVTAIVMSVILAVVSEEIGVTSILSFIGVAALMGLYLPRIRLHDCYLQSRRRITRVFPSFLDVLALTLESGLNFQSALQLSAQRLPGSEAGLSLRVQLEEILRDIRSGEHRLTALQKFSDRLALPQVTQFVASVTAAERQGVSVSTLLRRQAEQLRTSRALSAERHAMKMPVKLLAPLAICIFPCTFLILAFPLSVRLMGSGLF